MARKSERPSAVGCSVKGGLFSHHRWEYGGDWNGTPFVPLAAKVVANGTFGRTGWRCQYCGTFAWDQSDTEYRLTVYHNLGLIEVRMTEAAMNNLPDAKGR
jgi:hypothetical protein